MAAEEKRECPTWTGHVSYGFWGDRCQLLDYFFQILDTKCLFASLDEKEQPALVISLSDWEQMQTIAAILQRQGHRSSKIQLCILYCGNDVLGELGRSQTESEMRQALQDEKECEYKHRHTLVHYAKCTFLSAVRYLSSSKFVPSAEFIAMSPWARRHALIQAMIQQQLYTTSGATSNANASHLLGHLSLDWSSFFPTYPEQLFQDKRPVCPTAADRLGPSDTIVFDQPYGKQDDLVSCIWLLPQSLSRKKT